MLRDASSYSVDVSSHAPGTATAAGLVCVAQVSANVKGGCVNNEET